MTRSYIVAARSRARVGADASITPGLPIVLFVAAGAFILFLFKLANHAD